MRFEFDHLRFDGDIRSKWDVLLRIVGDFAVVLGGRQLYAEVEFCLVEFALALGKWLAVASDDGPDFVYTSMESETEGLVRFTLVRRGNWRVSAADENHRDETPLTTEQLRGAAANYISRLHKALVPRVDLFDHVEDAEDRRTMREQVASLSETRGSG